MFITHPQIGPFVNIDMQVRAKLTALTETVKPHQDDSKDLCAIRNQIKDLQSLPGSTDRVIKYRHVQSQVKAESRTTISCVLVMKKDMLKSRKWVLGRSI